MAKAGISTRLIRFVDTCVGHHKGGIANVCIIVACFFGAISGSGPATVAALGAVLIPAMVERGGFSAPFSTALMQLPAPLPLSSRQVLPLLCMLPLPAFPLVICSWLVLSQVSLWDLPDRSGYAGSSQKSCCAV